MRTIYEAHVTEAEWDARFLKTAGDVASWSKDPARKVGAFLVSADKRRFSIGYNGFPKGVVDSAERLAETSTRLDMTVHAELNAILNAGFTAEGCTLYCTSFPCHECAKAVIQARVVRVVAPKVDHHPESKWYKSWLLAELMLTEAGVCITYMGER